MTPERDRRPGLLVMNLLGTAVRDRHEIETCVIMAANNTGILAPRPRVNALMGRSLKAVLGELVDEQLGAGHPQRDGALLEACTHLERILENHFLVQPMEPRAGCLDLLQWARETGVPIGLCTGLNRHLTRLLLRRLDWDVGMNVNLEGNAQSLIQAVVTSDDVPRGRPFPFMIHRLMARLCVPEVRAVAVIGDTVHDLIAAHRAGAGCLIGLRGGAHDEARLAGQPHHHLIDELTEVPALFEPERLRGIG